MPINTDSIAADLFEFLRSRIESIDTLNEKGEPTATEEEAKVFGFEYSDNGVTLGNMTITILDDDRSNKSLKIYYGKDLADLTDRVQRKDFFDFLLDLRRFAKSRLLGFDIRDIAKQELTKRDLAPLLGDEQKRETEGVAESKFSKMGGTVKTSVQTLENCKLVIKHSERVNEEVPGARSRRIHKIFIVNNNNERFMMPFNNLGCGRAMAQHVNQGGNPYDNYGVEISNLANETKELGKFLRRTKGKTYVSEEADELIESAAKRYTEARTLIKRLQSDRGYKTCRESLLSNEDLPEALTNETFTTKSYDQQLESAMPYVWRAHKMNKQIKEMGEFESWANETTAQFDAPLNEFDMGQNDLGSMGDLVKDPKTGKLTVSLKKIDPNQQIQAVKKAVGAQVDVKLDNTLSADATEPLAGKVPLADRIKSLQAKIADMRAKITANPGATNNSKGQPFASDLDKWTTDTDSMAKEATVPQGDVEEIEVGPAELPTYDVEHHDDIELKGVADEGVVGDTIAKFTKRDPAKGKPMDMRPVSPTSFDDEDQADFVQGRMKQTGLNKLGETAPEEDDFEHKGPMGKDSVPAEYDPDDDSDFDDIMRLSGAGNKYTEAKKGKVAAPAGDEDDEKEADTRRIINIPEPDEYDDDDTYVSQFFKNAGVGERYDESNNQKKKLIEEALSKLTEYADLTKGRVYSALLRAQVRPTFALEFARSLTPEQLTDRQAFASVLRDQGLTFEQTMAFIRFLSPKTEGITEDADLDKWDISPEQKEQNAKSQARNDRRANNKTNQDPVNFKSGMPWTWQSAIPEADAPETELDKWTLDEEGATATMLDLGGGIPKALAEEGMRLAEAEVSAGRKFDWASEKHSKLNWLRDTKKSFVPGTNPRVRVRDAIPAAQKAYDVAANEWGARREECEAFEKKNGVSTLKCWEALHQKAWPYYKMIGMGGGKTEIPKLIDETEVDEAKKPQVPEMYRVDIGQGWQRVLGKAIGRVVGDGHIEQQGYADSSSTTWAAIVWNAKKLPLNVFRDKLRMALGAGNDDESYGGGGEFGGWLKVEPFEYSEEVDEAAPELNEALHDGQYVEFKPDSPYNDHRGEVYVMSQSDGNKCWIGDVQGRGWYTRVGELKRVARTDPRVKEYFGGEMDEGFDTAANHQSWKERAIAAMSKPLEPTDLMPMTNPDNTVRAVKTPTDKWSAERIRR